MAYQMRMVTSVRNNPLRRVFCLSVVVTGMVFWLAIPSSYAAPTKLLSYQGRVTDSNGQPITKAVPTYNMRFRLYNTNATDCGTDTAGANDIWEEILNGANKVQVTNGLFSVVLGNVNDFATEDFNSNYWLQLTVDSNDDAAFQAGEMFTTCDQLTTAPYAIRALDSNTASTATNANACSADNVCDVVDILAATNGQIDFFDEVGDKVYWYSNSYGTGIEASTLTDWSNSQFRWRVGGTSVATGTEEMLLTGSGLNLSQSNFISVGDTTNKTYFSSGGAFTHLAFNAYYNGTAWVGNNATLPYALYQQTGGAHNWYYAPAAANPAWGAAKMTLDTAGNLTVVGTITGTLSGTATNALACSGDGICDVQTVDSGQGSTEVHLMNQNIRTTDAVTFGELTTGDINVPGSITFGNNRADDGSYEWVGWNSGASRAGIFLWDGVWSGCTATKFCVLGDTHQLMLASNAGNVEINDAVDVTGYVSITGAQDTSGNLRFSAANPYISASSYFVAPGGAYFNVGTVYTEAAIQARGGINDDGASAKLDLIDADGVNITAGPLFMAGTAFCKRYTYAAGAGGVETATRCPTDNWMVVSRSYNIGGFCASKTPTGQGGAGCNVYGNDTIGGGVGSISGTMFCCWTQW